MEQTLGQEYFDNLLAAREGSEEALEVLVQSKDFSHVALFFGDVWNTLKQRSNVIVQCDDDWYNLVRPALFLAIMEVPNLEWKCLWNREQCCFANELYRHLMNATRREIEMFLLDGLTLEQELFRNEAELPIVEWDSDDDEFDSIVPDSMISPDNTEEQALARMTLEKIQEYLDEEEWIILTADYGDDPKLAETLGINVGALRMRRNRIRNRILILFE